MGTEGPLVTRLLHPSWPFGIRAQGSKAFIEQREDEDEGTSLPSVQGAKSTPSTAMGLSRFKAASGKVKVAAMLHKEGGPEKLYGSRAKTVASESSKSVKWLTSLDSPLEARR